MEDSPIVVPRLAPPGAGIPAIERVVGGAIFAFNRWRGTRERFAARFERERGVIAGLCRGGDERMLGERVLIPRLRGLEDSSRFWSVWMTLDHLRIVNDQITRVIESLTGGRVPEGRASTAAVKPSAGVGPEVRGAYEGSCDRLVALAASCPTLRTAVRYAHPWFGPLDGAGWHAMAAMHMGIHRAQIARILADAKGGAS
ncbi:MAG: DinB family protein [Planctomycetes bacterium]|nr:DinB family protein [Planctomycetota bacterium]